MSDVGIKITPKDIDAKTAADKDILMQFKYPQMLLDTQKDSSFKTINIFFSKDTPNPDGITNFVQNTEIYRYEHGYNYVPATWFLFLNTTNPTFKYGYNNGLIDQTAGIASASIYYEVDDKYVYLYVKKTYVDGFAIPPTDITARGIRLRVYCFANDIGA